MASIIWLLLLFPATLGSTSTALADGGNLTRLSAPFLCRPDQADALLHLKKTFSFRKSITTLSSWQDGTDCCFWEGVSCDDSSGNVTVLDLNNRGLSSYGLDPTTFNLTSLQRLDLSMNYFGPNWNRFATTRFERFALLTHLNLSNIGIQGPVPTSIGKLVNLLSLDISTNSDNLFSLQGNYYSNSLYASNFDTLVANLSSLRELYLDGVDLSDAGEKLYIYLATYVPRLQALSLALCGLRSSIHNSLSRLHSVELINLQENDNITPGPFPEFFMDFINLTVLQLSDTNLEGWFPSRYFQSKKLRVLDLSGNEDLSGYVPNFSNESSLETLRLDETNFSSPKPLPSRNFKLLKGFGLDGNLISSADFLSSLGSLESLQQLYLEFGSVSELGSIFTWLGDRKNLTSLTLYGCDFSLTTPSSVISSFKSLRGLTMVGCNLPWQIISAVGKLMDLETLEMVACTTYGSLLSSCSNLKNLINIQIIGSGFSVALHAAIGNLTKLQTMVVSCGCASSGCTSGTVPYTIGQLNKLRFLALNECYFTGRIPNSVANLTQLTKLFLSDNAFHGEIPSSIFTIPGLNYLELSSNQLSGPIPEFNQALSQLESIDLSNNEFSGPFPKLFFDLTSLIRLDLRWNNLIGVVDLSSFWKLRNIEILHLSYNKLHVTDTTDDSPLPSVDWSGPHVLGLASCNITQFPRSLIRSKYISYLDLSCNKISGDIPKQMWKICSSTIIYLNISHNMFTSIGLTSDVLPFTTVPYVLDLSFNRLQGMIPMPNSSAKALDYSNNRFSSVHPNWAFYLSQTSYLIMSNNNITGYIPFSICNSSLSILVLSNNSFSGPIPSCLIENGKLKVLNLKDNHFEGMMSSNITSECSLKTIDVHGNKIYGQLPRGLSNCQQLEVLDFGSNQIVDVFPSWLRGLAKLSVIVLRSNKFYGTIDDTADDSNRYKEFFPSLQIIDLASNNFSGSLRPEWIEWLKSMMATLNDTGETISALNISSSNGFYQDSIEIVYKGNFVKFERILTILTAIDFSDNRLEGAIPKSIGRLVSLRALNMSHNALTGKIPAQLGGMIDLESLDLSCNQLSGEIPQELTSLTFLDVLNLSNNQLVGEIPQARQFSTFNSSSFEGNARLCGPQLSESPCGAWPYNPGEKNVSKSSDRVDVVLFLFVGLGFGVGFATAIVVKLGRIGRWFKVTTRASHT